MNDMNFIPSYRLTARRRRARIRRWTTACVAWAIFLVTLYGGAYTLWGGGRTALAGDKKDVAVRIRESSQAIRILQHELAVQNLLLRNGQIVENQPDWSLLLAVLPQTLSGDVVLRRCELRADRPSAAPAAAPAPSSPAAAQSAAPGAETPTTYLLKVAGCGKTMPAVLQFVQELERTGLFDQVRLVETSPEAMQTLTVTGFQVECSLGGKEEGAR
jgi:hypothetical protein